MKVANDSNTVVNVIFVQILQMPLQFWLLRDQVILFMNLRNSVVEL